MAFGRELSEALALALLNPRPDQSQPEPKPEKAKAEPKSHGFLARGQSQDNANPNRIWLSECVEMLQSRSADFLCNNVRYVALTAISSLDATASILSTCSGIECLGISTHAQAQLYLLYSKQCRFFTCRLIWALSVFRGSILVV
ncbi:hypothetical protein FB451DRAFT_1167693 [Mycena latifolia]|nr:hypothetical protein FB451DRAFT_1167693 [Mycena latifolia]